MNTLDSIILELKGKNPINEGTADKLSQGLFFCIKCDDSFPTSIDLNIHDKSQHQNHA